MRRWSLMLVAVGLLTRPVAGADGGVAYHNDPIGSYQSRSIAGFTVLVSQRLAEHPAEADASLLELVRQLDQIARVVPPRPLAELRKVSIWLERDETAGLGEFHWGPDRLIRMKRNPAKARAVEITNARHLVEWAPIQPWAVLHELAHAYHCIILGDYYPKLVAAYDQACQSGKYDRVAYAKGGKQPAYARTNRAEYFAELSEAYFGRNDFEPFGRPDLRTFDPVGYQLMVDVWGEPVRPPEP